MFDVLLAPRCESGGQRRLRGDGGVVERYEGPLVVGHL